MKKPASVFVPLILGLILLMAFSPTVAATSTSATVKIIGKDTVKIGQKVFSTFHFSPDTIKITSGGTVTFENIATDEPHTISLVMEPELPTANNVFSCGPPGPTNICAVILMAHIPLGFDPITGMPIKIVQFQSGPHDWGIHLFSRVYQFHGFTGRLHNTAAK